ncbi:unnamed protein product [Phytomonas sp. Hart1]|nr:unnamed protein product [Phytomonas sp. Hart1]|eukprot:CCW71824.1 unnamed protein product [Phytomonas sp. isolate Hart1]
MFPSARRRAELPSLRRAFGVAIPPPSRPPRAGSLETTVLPSGLRIVSHDLDGPQCVLGIYAMASLPSPGHGFFNPGQGLSHGFSSTGQDPNRDFFSTGLNPNPGFFSTGQGPSHGFSSTGQDPSHGFSSGPNPNPGLSSTGPDPSHGFSSGPNPSHGFSSTGQDPNHGFSSGQGPSHSFTSTGPDPSHGFSSTGQGPSHSFTSTGQDPSHGFSSGPNPNPGFSSTGQDPSHGFSSGQSPSHGFSSTGPNPSHSFTTTGPDPNPGFSSTAPNPGLSYALRLAVAAASPGLAGCRCRHGEPRRRRLYWTAEALRGGGEAAFARLVYGLDPHRLHELQEKGNGGGGRGDPEPGQGLRSRATDGLEAVAFFKEPLGAPRGLPDGGAITAAELQSHAAALLRPGRIVLAGVNIPHAGLVGMACGVPLWAEEGGGGGGGGLDLGHHRDEVAQFHPGRQVIRHETGLAPNPKVIAAVGAVVEGGDESPPERAAAVLVAREVYAIRMEGEGAYHRWENPDRADGLEVFFRSYTTAALIGYTLCAAPSEVPGMVQAAVECFPQAVDPKTLEAAKRRAVLRFKRDELSTVWDYCNFIATSLLKPEERIQAIENITLAEVRRVLAELTSHKPSSFVMGDTFSFPKNLVLNPVGRYK